MRINWKSPLAKVLLMMLCLAYFMVAWPVGTSILLDSLPHARPTDDDLVGIRSFFAMIFVGFIVGIHAGMMIDERTLWLRSKAKRATFLLISGICAACITYDNSTGSVADPRYPAIDALLYFVAVQSLPLLWFLFNLHGEAWRTTLARRRNRKTQ